MPNKGYKQTEEHKNKNRLVHLNYSPTEETRKKLRDARYGGKEPKVNFLLKYDLDEDPIEEFETLNKVKERIKELMKNDDLDRDSIVIYEIKSKKEVEPKTSTTINIK